MQLFEARRTRRLLLRLDAGAGLPETLTTALRAARARTASLRGTGRVQGVELLLPDPSGGEEAEVVRRLEGPLVLVAGEGHFQAAQGGGGEAAPELFLSVLLGRETDRGADLVGGEMVAAEVVGGARFEIEVLEDLDEVPLALGGAARRAPGNLRGGGPQPPGAASPPRGRGEDTETAEPGRPAAGAWAQVAAISQAAEEESRAPAAPTRARGRAGGPGGGRKSGGKAPSVPVAVRPDPIPERRPTAAGEDSLDEPFPERGDYLDHRQFGLCRVDGEDSQGGLIIRLPSGRRKTINLDFLEVLPAEDRTEGRVFPVRPRRR